MVFRWSIWGDNKEQRCELLFYSISSFRKWFGPEHRYLLFADNKEQISAKVIGLVELHQFSNAVDTLFYVKSRATWLKWCPGSRISPLETEFYIDSDVFLLKYPTEIFNFLSRDDLKFSILDEFEGASWQHGSMQRKALPSTPYVNAGLFIQKAFFDITPDLVHEFNWWIKNIAENEHTHHDEQGALAVALTKYHDNNELFILPKEKYIIISKYQNSNLDNLNNITLIHTTYPDHPAFYKFLPFIKKSLLG